MIFSISCGTVQPFVPGVPLKKGDVQGRLTYSISTSNFAGQSIQSGFYYGLTNNDLIGFSVNNFPLVIPSHFAFSHYFPSKTNSISSLQFHIGELFRNEYNPFYEVDFAMSDFKQNNVNSIKIGLGYFGPTVTDHFSIDSTMNFNLIPTFGLQTFSGDFIAGIDFFPGLTKNYSSQLFLNPKPDKIFFTVSNSEVTEIAETDEKGIGYKIILKSGDNIHITDRDPYPDCIRCDNQLRISNAYLTESKYKAYWIFSKTITAQIIWLDINLLEEDFRNGKDLIFKTNSEAINEIKFKADSWMEDISFGFGIFNRK